jgi:site-specific DNA-methyltransferase (adenine-specific)
MSSDFVLADDRDYVILAENMQALPALPDESFDLIYIDPPFNTGRRQRRITSKAVRLSDDSADDTPSDSQSQQPSRLAKGFGGATYRLEMLAEMSYPDAFDEYVRFLRPRLQQAHRLLSKRGSLYLHLDYREVHYVKVELDRIFGRKSFLNEIVWAYDYGGRPKKRWPAKHDTILFYVKDPKDYYFDLEAAGKIPYMAPGLVGPEKAARGKSPTDVWWHTVVSPTGKEKTGYPTQKPEAVLERIIAASSPSGGRVLDFFAGSGTAGVVARRLGRRFVLIDCEEAAIDVTIARLEKSFGSLEGIEIARLSP